MTVFVVNTLDDIVASDGLVSLREAIEAANSDAAVNDAPPGAGADIIVFDPGLSGTIRLTGGQLVLTSDITIDGDTNGDGKADITISGDKTGNGQSSDDTRVLSITGASTDVVLDSLTITAGYVLNFNGGAIYQYAGTLLIRDSSVTDSETIGNYRLGGGVQARGDVTIVRSTIEGNSSYSGGGFAAGPGATVVIVDSTISNNVATAYGGGLYAQSGSIATVNTTISGNTAGVDGRAAGAASGGTLEFLSSTVTANSGSGATVNLHNGAQLIVTNSVIADNGGNEISEGGTDSTITANRSFFGTGTLTIDSGANNTTNGGDPGLGLLADNGGPVQTHAILAGSPLIGAGDAGLRPADTFDLDGDSNTTELLPLDANGNARVNGLLDIGADEFGLTVTSADDTGVDTTFGANLAADMADGGGLSLREAIHWASAGDKIGFSSSLTGQTIRLTSTELALTQDLTIDGDIDGDGKADITLSGDANDNAAADLGDVRVFNISGAETDVTLRSLKITNGYAEAGTGGAIFAQGKSLTIINSTISESVAASNGGGIWSSGTLNVANSLVAGNSAGSYGGGVYTDNSSSTFVNVTMSYNHAGAKGGAFVSGTLAYVGLTTFIGSTIVYNSAAVSGGGIDLYRASLTLRNTVVSNNDAPASSDISISDGLNAVTAGNSFLGTGIDVPTTTGPNIFGDDPKLRNFGDNGGPTDTFAPLANSPLLGKGSNAFIDLDTFDLDNDGNTAEATPIDGRGGSRIVGTVDIGAVERAALVITSDGGGASASKSIAENTTAVTTIAANDLDGVVYSIVGGVDSGKFKINATTGALSFKSARDFEAPADAGRNNIYDVVVRADDGNSSDTQSIAVTITNVSGNTINGSSKANKIDSSHPFGGKSVTTEEDVLRGKGGNDTLNGGRGNDTLKGSPRASSTPRPALPRRTTRPTTSSTTPRPAGSTTMPTPGAVTKPSTSPPSPTRQPWTTAISASSSPSTVLRTSGYDLSDKRCSRRRATLREQ